MFELKHSLNTSHPVSNSLKEFQKLAVKLIIFTLKKQTISNVGMNLLYNPMRLQGKQERFKWTIVNNSIQRIQNQMKWFLIHQVA